MHKSVVRASVPATEIMSLKAMKRYLEIAITNFQDDTMVQSMIVAARLEAEKYTRKSLVKKSYTMYLDDFPRAQNDFPYMRCQPQAQVIDVPFPPLISVTGFTYIDTNGAVQTLVTGTDCRVDFVSEPARILPVPFSYWPYVKLGEPNAVKITYTAGYEVKSSQRQTDQFDGSAISEPESIAVSVPSADQQGSYVIDRGLPETVAVAIKQFVKYWYTTRTPVISAAGAGGNFQPLPLHLLQLLNNERLVTL